MGDKKKRTDEEYARDLAKYFDKQMSAEAKGILGEDRAEKMMYYAARLVMAGGGPLAHAKYIFWCYLNVDYVKTKLSKYVDDRDVYDYWTQEVPEMMKDPRSKDIVEVFNGEFKKMANRMMISADSSLQTFIRVRVYRDTEPLIFVARVREYTPNPNPDLRNTVDFGCVGEVLIAPDGTKISENRERTRGALKDYVYKNYDEIMAAAELEAPVYRGGRQKLASIKIDGADFEIIGNTDNEESRAAYEKIKEDISEILESAKN